MTKLNKALMASTAIALAAGLSVPASAQDVKPMDAPGVVKSSERMKLTLYGQITRAVGLISDGESNTFKHAENGNTSTRMGIDGRGRINKEVSVRTRMEFAVRSNSSLNQFEDQNGANDFDIRHTDFIVSHARLGSVWIGRGDAATNGTSEVDLAPGIGTARLGGTNSAMFGGVRVLRDDGVVPRDLAALTRFFDSYDGAGRTNRIRYDTPTFAGFQAGASWIDKDGYDVALKYSGTLAGQRVAGAVGYCHTTAPRVGTNANASDSACWGGANTRGVSQVNGSASILTTLGLGATISAGKQWKDLAPGATHASAGAGEGYNLNPSIWYTFKPTELGPTTIEYSYNYTKDADREGDKGQSHAVTLAQVVSAVGLDTFLTVRTFQVETAALSTSDINRLWFFGGGFRARF